MSIKAIVAAVVLAFGLVVAAFFVNRAQPAGTQAVDAPEQLLDFRPARVSRIITTAGGITHAVVRGEDLAWSYLASTGETWPAAPSDRSLGALGRISGLTSVSGAPDRALPDDADEIQLELEDGTVHTVRFAREALGGKIVASVGAGSSGEAAIHLVNANDVLPLVDPGLASWRIGSALPGARDASRISLTPSTGATIELAKIDGAWGVTRPVSARANEEAVASLLDSLSLIQINSFIDSARPGAGETGLDSPALSIRTERDERSVDAQGDTRTNVRARELYVGGPSGASGELSYAAPSLNSAFLMLVPSDTLTSISTSPRNYLALTASQLTRDDIGLITSRTGYDDPVQRGFRRQRGEWTELLPDGTTRQANADSVEALLTFLLEEPGEPEPASLESINPAARITLHDASGRPLQSIEFAYTADRTPYARSNNIDVLYYDFSPPALLTLPSFTTRSLESPASSDVTVPENAPTGK